MCFPVNIADILRAVFWSNTSGGCFSSFFILVNIFIFCPVYEWSPCFLWSIILSIFISIVWNKNLIYFWNYLTKVIVANSGNYWISSEFFYLKFCATLLGTQKYLKNEIKCMLDCWSSFVITMWKSEPKTEWDPLRETSYGFLYAPVLWMSCK